MIDEAGDHIVMALRKNQFWLSQWKWQHHLTLNQALLE
jgi:hypothetical protein